jgi:HD superfamily phosphohydrolase YqeK
MVRAVDDESPQSRAEHFRGVADMLRGLANQLRYDLHRADQLRALADGFERFARRLEREVGADTRME